MARQPATKSDNAGEVLPFEASDTDRSVDSLLADLGGITENESKVTVYRAATGDGRKNEAWLFECHPSEFDLPRLAAEYGGGRYRIVAVRYDESAGQRVRCLNRIVEVEAPKESTWQSAKAPMLPIQSPATDAAVQAIQHGFAQMMQAQERMLQMLVTRNQVQPDDIRRGVFADLAAMREILGPRESNGGGMQLVDALVKGMEIARTMAPREGEAGTADVIMEALKTFGPLASVALQQQNAATPVAEHNASSEPPVLPSPAPTPSPMNPLAEYAARLLPLAAQQSDPGLYAELIYDQAPPAMLDPILQDAGIVDKLILADARVAQYRAWFDALLSELRKLDQEAKADVSGTNGSATGDTIGP